MRFVSVISVSFLDVDWTISEDELGTEGMKKRKEKKREENGFSLVVLNELS